MFVCVCGLEEIWPSVELSAYYLSCVFRPASRWPLVDTPLGRTALGGGTDGAA